MVARSWPAFTLSPTATLSEARVPLVLKFSLAEVAADTFPDAETLDCTVPVCTVTVRASVVDAEDEEP